jgi:exopolysaccharide production protein ExoZ
METDVRPTVHNLQGLRGVACLLVLGIHIAAWESSFGIGRPLLKIFIWFGYSGVDLFFVLSGFIITHTQGRLLGQPAAVPRYLFRRAWRIYPTFLLMMLFSIVALLGMTGQWAYPNISDAPGVRTRWISWLTLAPCRAANLYLAPAWSLCFEVLFYLAFSLLMLLPRRVGPWLLAAWAVGIGILAVYGGPTSFTKNPWVEHLGSPFVWEFLIGCMLAWGVDRGWCRFGKTSIAAGLGWGLFWVLLLADPEKPAEVAANVVHRVFVFGIAAALIVYGAVAVERRNNSILPGWLQRCGDASYSIYLWHAPAGAVVYHYTLLWPHTLLPHIGWLLLVFVVCLGGGFALYLLFERPMQNLVRKARMQKPTTPPMVTITRIEIDSQKVSEPAIVQVR